MYLGKSLLFILIIGFAWEVFAKELKATVINTVHDDEGVKVIALVEPAKKLKKAKAKNEVFYLKISHKEFDKQVDIINESKEKKQSLTINFKSGPISEIQSVKLNKK